MLLIKELSITLRQVEQSGQEAGQMTQFSLSQFFSLPLLEIQFVIAKALQEIVVIAFILITHIVLLLLLPSNWDARSP